MKFEIDELLFNHIFPFSFQTNQQGKLVFIGKSLKKLFHTLDVGQFLSQEFRLIRPKFTAFSDHPGELIGELIILGRNLEIEGPGDDPSYELLLRGQVIVIPSLPDTYLFWVTPLITEMKQITSWSLDFSDFPLGDPIFDLLILLQSERHARQKAEVAKLQVEWESKRTHLLHKITLASADLNELKPAIELTLREVSEELDWQIGQAFIQDRENPEVMVSSGSWYLSDPERFKCFIEVNSKIRFLKGRGFIGFAFETGHVNWVYEPGEHSETMRREAFQMISAKCCVQVPILVQGAVVALLEFISVKNQSADPNILRFFEILSHQLATVIERQNSRLREKEQLAAMAASSKLAALGEMAAGVGHEINNPLTAALLGVECIQAELKKAEINRESITKVLQQMKTACVRIAKIVAALKMIGREGSGDPLVDVSIKEIVDDTLILCQAGFKGRDVRLHVKGILEGSRLMCRPVQISQVILNLLSNAFDAVAGTPHAWIKLEGKDLGDELELSVTDSGRGIPPYIVEKIMRPFFTTKPAGKGTGLGLSVSRKIVADHGGSLDLDLRHPHTRFVVKLPKRILSRCA